jgi:hypothetical protein
MVGVYHIADEVDSNNALTKLLKVIDFAGVVSITMIHPT